MEVKESPKAVSDAAKLIATAVALEIQRIATAAEVAKQVIANSAAEAVKVSSTQTSGDHDILTTLVNDVKHLTEGQREFHLEMKKSIQELQNNYSNRITLLEKTKADLLVVEKIETRLDALEKWQSKVLGIAIGVGALSGLATSIVFYVLK